MSQDHDNYWQAVQDVVENVVVELADADPEEDRHELLTRLVHDRVDQHDYVIRDDLQVHTLQYSDHPSAALFNGTVLVGNYMPGDNFPFAKFAADALEADVIQRAKQLLELQDWAWATATAIASSYYHLPSEIAAQYVLLLLGHRNHAARPSEQGDS